MFRIKIEEVTEFTDQTDYPRERTKEIYTQTVETLDIAAVIATVNDLEFIPPEPILKQEEEI